MRTNSTKNQLGLAPMRIPKIRASWNDPPPPNTPTWSQAGLETAQERRDLGRDALGLVLHDEVPGVVEDHEVGVRDLLGEAMRARHRRVVVLGAPEDQRRHAERGEAAPVGRELLEVARLVERE